MKKIFASLSAFIFGETITQEYEARLKTQLEHFKREPSSFSEEQKKALLKEVKKVRKNYSYRIYAPVWGYGTWFCKPIMCTMTAYNQELADQYSFWEAAEKTVQDQ